MSADEAANRPVTGDLPRWIEEIPDDALRDVARAWSGLSEVQREIISASVATFAQANEGRKQ